jgi:hypothetical protein
MHASRLPRARLLIAFVVLTGCGLASTSVHAPPECGFPEGTAFAYAGETSLTALGLATNSSGDHAIGRIFVTRDRIPFTGSLPYTPAGPGVVPDQRQYCALYGESTSLGGVPDDWGVPRP